MVRRCQEFFFKFHKIYIYFNLQRKIQKIWKCIPIFLFQCLSFHFQYHSSLERTILKERFKRTILISWRMVMWSWRSILISLFNFEMTISSFQISTFLHKAFPLNMELLSFSPLEITSFLIHMPQTRKKMKEIYLMKSKTISWAIICHFPSNRELRIDPQRLIFQWIP